MSPPCSQHHPPGSVSSKSAEPGDTLAVTIKDIQLKSNVYIIVKTGHGGVLRKGVPDVPMTRIVEVTSEKIVFNETLQFAGQAHGGQAPSEGSIASV